LLLTIRLDEIIVSFRFTISIEFKYCRVEGLFYVIE